MYRICTCTLHVRVHWDAAFQAILREFQIPRTPLHVCHFISSLYVNIFSQQNQCKKKFYIFLLQVMQMQIWKFRLTCGSELQYGGDHEERVAEIRQKREPLPVELTAASHFVVAALRPVHDEDRHPVDGPCCSVHNVGRLRRCELQEKWSYAHLNDWGWHVYAYMYSIRY